MDIHIYVNLNNNQSAKVKQSKDKAFTGSWLGVCR
jgi:hypothetical protein